MWTVVGDMEDKPPLAVDSLRFAVGVPDGKTSQRWTLHRQGSDVYLGCPEVPEAKLSLHSSGVCRMAFTQEAVDAGEVPDLPSGDRVFHKWRPRVLPAEVYRVLLPAASITVLPSERQSKKWSHVIFVRPPDGCRVVVASLWICSGRGQARPPSGVPYLWLASTPLPDERWVELVMTAPQSGPHLECLSKAVADFTATTRAAGGDVDETRASHAFSVAGDGVPYAAVFTVQHLRVGEAESETA